MKREYRMQHLIWGYNILLLTVTLCIIIYINVFALGQLSKREHMKEQDALDSWMNVMDQNLSNNTLFVNNFIVNSASVAKLNTAKADSDRYYALMDIKETIQDYARLNYGMNEIFFYSDKGGANGYITTNRDSNINTHEVKEHIQEIISLYGEEDKSGSWIFRKMDGKNCLIYMVERDGNYAGCWCTVEYLVQMISNQRQETRKIFITDKEGISYADHYLQDERINLGENIYTDNDTGVKYVQVFTESNLINICLVEHVEKNISEASLLQIRNMMVVLSIVLIAMIFLASNWIERKLYQPIRNVIVRMEDISVGNFETKINDNTSFREIRILNETFNRMVEEIKNLKIGIYEERLKEQKTTLQYLQLQIRPHFLVNVLNSVYSMTEMRDYENAQQMCRYLVTYFRFLYNKNSNLILLSEEMEHVRTYIKIQKMRLTDCFVYKEYMDEACRYQLLPPLTILTFIENSIKYGFDLEKAENFICITSRITCESMEILVRDSGPGFPEEVLAWIEMGKQPAMDGKRVHIGIHNVMERLKLFYPGTARITFYNDNGACVKIKISLAEL